MYCCITLKQYNVCASNDPLWIETWYSSKELAVLCNGKTHKRSNSLSNKNCQDQLHSIIKLENCVIVVTSTWDTSILKVASEKILRDT